MTTITEHYITTVLARAWMHYDDELVALTRYCDDQIKDAGSVEEKNVFDAFARLFESNLTNPPKNPVRSRPSTLVYKGPKPKFVNCCKHPFDTYAGVFEGADLYFYFAEAEGEWSYCLRRSDTDSDYRSGTIEGQSHELGYGYPATSEERLEHSNWRLELLRRFFRHTQTHRCR